jgi:hypothetical protein
MPAQYTPEGYIEKKNDILTRCLRQTEDIYSSVGEPEALADLLAGRMETIAELEVLENEAKDAKKACSEKALAGLDSDLRLILSLDAKIEAAMNEAKSEILDSMKSNTAERKFMRYANVDKPDNGRLLDEKQ